MDCESACYVGKQTVVVNKTLSISKEITSCKQVQACPFLFCCWILGCYVQQHVYSCEVAEQYDATGHLIERLTIGLTWFLVKRCLISAISNIKQNCLGLHKRLNEH